MKTSLFFRVLVSSGALFLLVSAGVAASSTRLFEIGVTRFSTTSGMTIIERGRLNALGQFDLVSSNPVAVNPGSAANRFLVYTEAWSAYADLGTEALANFEKTTGAPLVVGGLIYYEVAAREDAKFDVGEVVNLSTRGRMELSATNSLVGGFVVTERPRRVLVRAIGPGLAAHGVTGVAANPFLTIYENGLGLYYNDNWGSRPDAAEIAATALQVGAFPLDPASADAALLVELPPGLYTVQAVAQDAAPGVGLIEIYLVP
ncbi:hypothetical protein [Synoicihabitans lomoniglobus]|uniref:Uncharacterized protein n=1 Tax=Synoicihabitans lomoniglobus TaxID=2909285 RepID=A0AAF0A0I4_9BACT|nr:hypothetical protein [Opitutaceae bacterium LMO-M01]WED65023.1 hypothetical protein PXH66_21960 [Opitutaceae bacterium LMO-M01]